MTDRDVHVIVPMKASEIKRTRELIGQLAQYPACVAQLSAQAQQLVLDEPTEGDGEELARLLGGLKQDAVRAEAIRRELRAVFARAVISDPYGKKEVLQ